jgi:membrane-bound hydrogenase subunit beta
MSEENDIQQELTRQFSFLVDKVKIQRVRRIFAVIPPEKFAEVFDYAIKKLKFVILAAITGLDEGPTLGFIYHIARENGIVLNLHISVPKENPVIKTVTHYFPAADAYERELVDLLGAKVEGLDSGFRYPLPDDWPANQFPLRKDWKVEMLDKKEVTKNA